jgi:FKBP-type peptidyl-prolyl cis-trans isomerase SlyD
MSTKIAIGDGKVATFHYTLKNDAGKVLDTSSGRAPLAYLHGAGNIVPGLERELAGKVAGDRFEVRVAPTDGYGEREGGAQPVDRKMFPPDARIEAGMMFHAQTPDGQTLPLWVDRVEESTVWVDENHPLAGVALNFAVEVVMVRDATESEREHGHPHGPDGHGHHDHGHDDHDHDHDHHDHDHHDHKH